ncbi:hypothetical protein HpDR57_15620 [Helicobacter pylori]
MLKPYWIITNQYKTKYQQSHHYLLVEDKDENIGIYTNLCANKTFSF